MRNMITLGERLKAAREDLGWNKAELKRRAGLKAASTITELENGTITHSPQLPAIAAALGVDVLWLQKGGDLKEGQPRQGLLGRVAMDCAEIIDRLPKKEQVELLHHLWFERKKMDSANATKSPRPDKPGDDDQPVR